MSRNVTGLLFSFLTATACGASALAQQQPAEQIALNNQPTATQAAAPVLTASDRLAKVRAMIAARQLNGAAYELDKIRKETGDEALQSVARTMLVGVYLEIPDYNRANALLEETFARSKNRKNGMENIFLPVAGQVIKSAGNQLERYKKLGFNICDPKLPAEAIADLDRWRKMLETVVEHARQMSMDEKKSAESLAILEEAATARGTLARDQYEAAAWKNVVEDTRELIAAAQTKVTDVDGTTVDMKNVAELKLPVPSENTVAANTSPAPAVTAPVFTPVKTAATEEKIVAPTVSQPTTETPKPANNDSALTNLAAKTEVKPEPDSSNVNRLQSVAENPVLQKDTQATDIVKPDMKIADNGLMKVGSLVDMATRKFPPMYPATAKTARIAGIVKVEVVVDEQGSVTEVKTAEGPEMLRRAATEAIKRWKFKPAIKDGQPVRMSGYVNFNFTL